jgi:hypothetical protein
MNKGPTPIPFCSILFPVSRPNVSLVIILEGRNVGGRTPKAEMPAKNVDTSRRTIFGRRVILADFTTAAKFEASALVSFYTTVRREPKT